MIAGRFALVVVGIALAIGCGGGEPQPVIEREPAPAAEPVPHPAAVSSDRWTDGAWPLSIDRGLLICTPIRPGNWPALYISDVDGRMWPLNGIASSHADRFGAEPSIDLVWLDNPEIPGTKVFLTELIDRANALC